MAEGGFWCDETNQECAPRYNHNAQVQWEHASIETCAVMNLLGYGSHIRQARRDVYREWDRLVSAALGTETVITTGSKAEGLTRYSESDKDILIVLEGVMCLENDVNYDTLSKETTVFTLNTDMCYHGHCILFIAERPHAVVHPLVHNALCAGPNGRAFLSSDLYVNAFKEDYLPDAVPLERAGPSIPMLINGVLHTDNVFSFHCYCPSILRKFAERRRHWPPPDVVHKVVSMGAFVTPVGYKGSENKHVEWRICFNTGENELVSSLNNTQVYIYVILKMVVKEVLKPLKKELTSYVVKNIVFWLSENNPQDFFNERTLIHWIREGLKELRSAILTEHLSYYMIPARNLMASCGLDEEQTRAWVQMITNMIDIGPNVLFRLPTIRQAIISHPEPLLWYSKKRVELELLYLKKMIRLVQCSDYNGQVNRSDTILQALKLRTKEIFSEIIKRMYLEGSRVDNSMRYIKLLFRMH